MDSFELNKMAGALLATVFVLMSVRMASDAIFHVGIPKSRVLRSKQQWVAAGGEQGGAEPAALEPIAPLLAAHRAARAGETVFKKCASCTTIDSGGANKVGPNLYGIVGRGMGAHEGFNYSAALKEFGAAARTGTMSPLHNSSTSRKPISRVRQWVLPDCQAGRSG